MWPCYPMRGKAKSNFLDVLAGVAEKLLLNWKGVLGD
jgi:hypothetical protein